jgi:hypothetical protein
MLPPRSLCHARTDLLDRPWPLRIASDKAGPAGRDVYKKAPRQIEDGSHLSQKFVTYQGHSLFRLLNPRDYYGRRFLTGKVACPKITVRSCWHQLLRLQTS